MRWLTTIMFMLAAAQVLADDLTAGKKVYIAKCARCHRFYDPMKYDDVKWSEWMGKMRKKARLGDEQYATLSRYLQTLRPSQQEAADAEEKKQ